MTEFTARHQARCLARHGLGIPPVKLEALDGCRAPLSLAVGADTAQALEDAVLAMLAGAALPAQFRVALTEPLLAVLATLAAPERPRLQAVEREA